MLLTGVAAGVLYDLLSLLKRGWGKTMVICVDILIFVLTGLMAAMVAVFFQQGRLRYYLLFAMLAGGLLYAFLPRAAAIRLAHAIRRKRKTGFGGE